MGRNTWEKGFDKRPVRTGLRLTAALIGSLMLLGAGVWGVRVLLSGPKGGGDGVIQKNSSDNWINAQTQFHQDFQTYTTYLTQITDAAKTLADYEKQPRPTDGLGSMTWQEQDKNLRTTLTGLSQQCQNTVTDYNTRSKAFLSKDFKDDGLPDQLDATQCKPAGVS